MRILMISDVYFPRVNGVSTSIRTFRDELRRQGHAVTLVCPEYGRDHSEDDEDIVRLPGRTVPFDPEDRLVARGALRRLIPERLPADYDLVHIQTPFAAHYGGVALARKLAVPVVESYHTYFEEYFYNYVPLVPRSMLRFLARHFSRSQCAAIDGLVVPSGQMLSVLRDYGIRQRAKVIPTGVDAAHFAAGDGHRFRERFDIPAEQPLLVHVGRMAHEKNVGFLLRVVARVVRARPDVLFVLAGEGPALGHLKQLARKLGIADSVRFVGYLDRASDLPDCFAAGDLFLFASRTETQGLVLLEAMATGSPVLSTAVMGTQSIMNAGEGGLALPEDEAAFERAIVELLADHGRRGHLANQARCYAQQWSVPVMAERLLSFYELCLGRQPQELVESEAVT